MKLEQEIEATFEEMQDFYNMKIGTDVVNIEQYKEQARKFYHDEMQKTQLKKKYMEPEKLQELHKSTVKAAVQHVDPKNGLKKTQKKLLKDLLQASFQKYEDKNHLLLNFGGEAEPAIGIDLGTTYCCVAVVVNGKVEIIRNSKGTNTTASYVTILKDGSTMVGNASKDAAHRYVENTVFDAKRISGRRLDDPRLQDDMAYWPFSVVQGSESGGPAFEVFGKQYQPEQISSFLLKSLAEDASNYLQRPVKKVVITVPAYFTDGQRQATIDAGELAGLQVLTILNEPTAASIAYKLERFHEDARNVLIFDLGGGTFDVAVLKTDANNIEVVGVDGDTHLGGEDFDKALMQYCATQFKTEHKLDPLAGTDPDNKVKNDKVKKRLIRLQNNCEKAKMELSFARITTISIDAFVDETDLSVDVSRETFEDLNSKYFQKAISIVDRALLSAKMARETINDIVLVGGSTQIPKVREMLKQYFNGRELNHTINPDVAVAYGAAVKAALMNGNQAGEIKANIPNTQDVTPMSIGVDAWVNGQPGYFSVIIQKNSKIPMTTKQVYRTLKDDQDTVLVRIYQGEQQMAEDNEFLGEFILRGVPPAPAGSEAIEVHMNINETGVLHVTAVVESTRGSETLVVSECKGRLSKYAKESILRRVFLNI